MCTISFCLKFKRNKKTSTIFPANQNQLSFVYIKVKCKQTCTIDTKQNALFATKKGDKYKNLLSEHLKKVLLSSNCLCNLIKFPLPSTCCAVHADPDILSTHIYFCEMG